MSWYQDIATVDVLGNSIQDWGIALGVSLVFFLVLVSMIEFAAKKLSTLDKDRVDGILAIVSFVVRSTKRFVLFLVAVQLGIRFLALPPRLVSFLEKTTMIAVLVQVAIWGGHMINHYLSHYAKDKVSEDPGSETTLNFTVFFVKISFWVVIALVGLDNLGVNVSALIAGLGVGGIAVALAAQNILGDLFSSLSIVLDKPFVVGDFIITGSEMGTVQKIGLKTTRVLSLSGEHLVYANSDLLKSRIRNYKRMRERRVVFVFGVVYQTKAELLKQIPTIVEECTGRQPKTRFDRAHFLKFGSSSLDFEVVYWMLDPDYGVYMDTQQEINLAIFTRFEELGIEFAYPTQTVFVHNEQS